MRTWEIENQFHLDYNFKGGEVVAFDVAFEKRRVATPFFTGF